MSRKPPRKKKILNAAVRVFMSYGPRKTTVADIAREAHVGVGTVYLEFRNKNALLRAISRSRFERVHERMREALEGDGAAPDRLRRALNARVATFLDVARGRHGPDLFACASRAIQTERQAFTAAERALFADFLREAHRRGELVAEDPELVARVLLEAYRRFTPPQLFDIRERLTEELAMMHELVLGGLLPRGEGGDHAGPEPADLEPSSS